MLSLVYDTVESVDVLPARRVSSLNVTTGPQIYLISSLQILTKPIYSTHILCIKEIVSLSFCVLTRFWLV